MKFLRFSVLTIGTLVSIFNGIFAQLPLLEKTENEVIILNSDNYSGLESVLQKIANESGQSISSLNYQVTLQKTIRLFAQGRTGGNYQGEIEIKVNRATNNLKYRQFSIQKSLVPNFIGCKIWDKTEGSPQLVKQFKMMGRKSDNRYEGKFDGYYSKPANNLKISAENITLHYSLSTENGLQQEMDRIDRYYEMKETLKHYQSTLDAIKPNSLTKVEQNKEKLERIKQKIEEANKLNYALKLSQNDPADLLSVLRKLRETYETTNNEYQKASSNRHISYHENALRLMQYGQMSEGVRFLKLSIEANPNYAPAQLTLAKLELKHSKLDDCQANVQTLRKLQQLSSTDAQTRSQIRSFYRDVYGKYVERGDEKLREKEYEDALEDYQEAQKIADFMGSSRDIYKDKTEAKVKQLKTSQFEDITKRAENQMTGSNLTESYQLLLEAEEFREDNEDFIKEEAPLNQAYQKLYRKTLEQAENRMYDRNYTEALNAIELAEKICEKRVLSNNCRTETDSYIRKVKTKQFENIVTDARNQVQNDNFEGAESTLKEAENFQNRNRDFIRDDAILKNAWQALFDANLLEIKSLVSEQRYNKALNAIDLAKRICRKEVLSNNCQTEINNYLRKIKTKQFENIIADARNQMENDNFEGAKSTLIEAEDFQNRNRDFIRDNTILQNAWEALFENNLLKIKKLVTEQKYNSAVDKLESLKWRLKNYPKINLEPDLKRVSEKAYSGKYKQDFQEAQNFRKSKNYTKALQQLHDLEEDGKRHTEFILDLKKLPIRAEYILILKGFIQEAETANASQNFEEALVQLDKANKLIDFQPSDKQRIYKNHFTAKFGIGVQNKNRQDYEKAVYAFEQAENFAQNQTFSNASKSEQKARSEKLKVVGLWIDKNLQMASTKINPQEIHTAKKLVQEVSELSEKYHFKLSSELKKRYADLIEKIRLEECRIAKNVYQSALETAQSEIESRLFAGALTTLKLAIQSAKNTTACSVETSKANQLLQKYKDVGVYQQTLNSANRNLQNSDFKSFEEEYLGAENDFETQNLKRFGLEHANFKTFVLQQNRVELWHFLAVRYSDIDLKFTQKLLNQLTRKNYDKYSMRNLGKEIARKDFAKFSDKKAKRLVEKYNFSKDGFKQFRKGYLQAWKDLD